jgi:Uma2 family endonuclease
MAGPLSHETPLLVIEVASESQSLAQLRLKAQVYRQAAIDEVWIVDAKSRTVEMWNDAGVTALDDTQTLASALLPGFAIAVRYLLDG